MSIVWLIIMLVSITALLFINPSSALEALIKGANDSVTLALNLIALYGIWLGVFEILESTGISDKLAKLLRPLVRKLFKGESEEAEKYISMNVSANLLGLGNAATPMGIGAVGAMKPNEKNPNKASTNMIMLIVISATSLQIFPSTVIGLRASAGSANPADFIIPCIIATVSSTVLGIIGVKIIGALESRLSKKRELKLRVIGEAS
ncbi:MAG: hypothetical protein IJX05_02355 [Clostridia bacterium]|nr:hypothetical protein [Clostridia bacterium]